MKALGHASTIIAACVLLLVLVCVIFVAYKTVLTYQSSSNYTIPPFFNSTITTTIAAAYNVTFNSSTTTIYPTNISTGSTYSTNQIIEYTLNLINSERTQFGLRNVTLSNETSAQEHSESMLSLDYFSHWDNFGMKPYMRYTLVGGTGAVDENVAYREYIQQTCIGSFCKTDPVNVTQSILYLENNMLYNDSACCNNGHRYNILNPDHNEVSIGVAYNATSVYLTEDFINNYISWLHNTPNFSGYNVSLEGTTLPGTRVYGVQINYDPLPQNMTVAQLDSTGSYDSGQQVGGVVTSAYYYPNLTNIHAYTYNVNGNYFDIGYNMGALVGKYGPGVYTTIIYLNSTTNSTPFEALTYSIFVNNDLSTYVPSNV